MQLEKASPRHRISNDNELIRLTDTKQLKEKKNSLSFVWSVLISVSTANCQNN